ncbi:MAG TPA: alpha/beta fold hydrolase [Ktedonobacterales bacterium]|nr:alpha/beta fold hydrolase [Ktedonobacterales bacterium]
MDGTSGGGDNDALPLAYLEYGPRQSVPEGEKPPLLLMLHGVGANERDLFPLAPELDPRLQILSLRAPLTRGPNSYAWFTVAFLPEGYKIAPEQLDASRKRVVEFIHAAIERYDADPERVYLLGFSQGAIMSLAVALTEPELLAGVIALSGRIPPEVEPWIVAPERTAGLPIFLAHGRQDSVIPYEWAERAKPLLERQRVALEYHAYDMEHQIGAQTLADLIAWLSAHLDAPRREGWA